MYEGLGHCEQQFLCQEGVLDYTGKLTKQEPSGSPQAASSVVVPAEFPVGGDSEWNQGHRCLQVPALSSEVSCHLEVNT